MLTHDQFPLVARDQAAYLGRAGLHLRSPDPNPYEIPDWQEHALVVQEIYSPEEGRAEADFVQDRRGFHE